MSSCLSRYTTYSGTATYSANSYGDTLYPIRVKVQNAFGGYSDVTALSDSVTGDTTLYWKMDNILKYGTMEDLYCSYIANKETSKYQVLSVRRNPATRNPPYQKALITPNNIDVSFQEIKDVSYHDIKPVYKVTLRNGKTIKVTKDHSIFCSDSVKKGITARTLYELDNVISIDNYHAIKDNECKPLVLSDDMITFMGLWTADGSYQKDKKGEYLTGVRISTGGEKKTLEWLENFASQFNDKVLKGDGSGEILQSYKNGQTSCLKYSNSRNGDVYINRRILAIQIYNIMGNVYSETKRVPKELFTASSTQITAFLKGYFSGDGSVHICNDNPMNKAFKYGSYYCVDCCSINRPLLEDISTLLDRLGIKHNISSPQKPSKTGYKNAQMQYKLIIHKSESVNKFMRLVGIIKEHNFKERQTYKREGRDRNVSLRDVRKIEFIGPEPVYDISVANTEAFIANGILCHNTGNEKTIFKREVADLLGIPLERGEHFNVKGINGNGMPFRKFKLYVKIGDLDPIPVSIGFAMRHGDLVENLLGNEDIVKSGKFEAIYDKNGVTYRSKDQSRHGKVACGEGAHGRRSQQTMNNLYEQLVSGREKSSRRHRPEAGQILANSGWYY